jgi:hypothetical protein
MDRPQSGLSIGAITPLTWRGQDGKVHRRVTFELRGVLVMPLDAARSFETDLEEAIRDAESA